MKFKHGSGNSTILYYYKRIIAREWIINALQAGLYEKWVADAILETKARSRRRQRESKNKQEIIQSEEKRVNTNPETLSLDHLQGAFVILVLGVLLAAVSIALENLLARVNNDLYSVNLNNNWNNRNVPVTRSSFFVLFAHSVGKNYAALSHWFICR